MEENTNINSEFEYGSDAIKTLDWKEHIRRRPGMYIGKLGDGSHADDGIYVLLKEVLDNALDEHMMGFGKQIVVEISSEVVSVRDYGRTSRTVHWFSFLPMERFLKIMLTGRN